VVEDRQRLVEAVADGALADDGQLRVDVHGSRSGDEEEPGLEVLQIVGGQRWEALAVDGEHPVREVASVEREQARGIRERRLDVAPLVAHDERVAVEDLDDGLTHRLRPVRDASVARFGADPGTRAGWRAGARCRRSRGPRSGAWPRTRSLRRAPAARRTIVAFLSGS